MNDLEKERLQDGIALSPLDGRYRNKVKALADYFSEYGLFKQRVRVEVEWLVYLMKTVSVVNIDKNVDKQIMSIYKDFNQNDFLMIKKIEDETKHDVKAVELFVDEKLKEMNLAHLQSFVHIGCTSEDINNNSYALMLKDGLKNVWFKSAAELIKKINEMAGMYANVPMLAHTHGQPATPTTVGKELAVVAHRLCKQLEKIKNIKIEGKFNGATGNYSAISFAYPNLDWQTLSRLFVTDKLGLNFNPVTTQIENHDYMCNLFDAIKHFNNILIGFNQDMWQYISMEYFKQQVVATEVGSSTMPHKVNPIRFENSESNADMSNSILVGLSKKLSTSRMQRDLSDSSSQRNIGIALGYSLQAITETLGGLGRVEVNREKLASDLNNRYEVLAEPVQTMLRVYGVADAYDRLKKMSRGVSLSKEILHTFINDLDIDDKDKERVRCLTPESYVGQAERIAKETEEKIKRKVRKLLGK